MLLGFNSFSFTTTEARAQAGDEAQVQAAGGGDRAVTIDVTSNTQGVTVIGPIDDHGLGANVSAYLLQFTPPNPEAQPPQEASVSIAITPKGDWTLQQPDPANIPVVRQTPRGDFAEQVDWAAVLLLDGNPEDDASGQVVVFWPWAEILNAEAEPTETLEIAKMEESLKADGELVIDDDDD